MLVVTRYRVPPEDAAPFRDRARRALEVLAEKPGWRGGHVGRAADDPGLWVVTSEWENVGSYRRALSSYESKLEAVPLLSLAIDEPTAFELVATVPGPAGGAGGAVGAVRAADADAVGLGSAAGPIVPTDFDHPPAGGSDASLAEKRTSAGRNPEP
ncbi:antibiotic biosynthesis monooxygenase [Jiangella asiatica]|uniref:Antibiotic biosynthesis monooxygenase n=2 Tax=Jiangella asiatica TaxID=2530372 RepID=A0A4R5CMU7_9ACTN|nr:antibiotic biosynthesis monooxygenase [Jiangella asiatica]